MLHSMYKESRWWFRGRAKIVRSREWSIRALRLHNAKKSSRYANFPIFLAFRFQKKYHFFFFGSA